MTDLRAELLAVEGCPHLERARVDLGAVLREGIIETPVELILVGSLEDAEFLAFPGSPTIRINGEDVVPEPSLPPSLSCRVYTDESGRRQGSPPIERIRAAVQAHRRGRLQSFQREEAGRVAAAAREAAGAEADGGQLVEADGAQLAEPGGAPLAEPDGIGRPVEPPRA